MSNIAQLVILHISFHPVGLAPCVKSECRLELRAFSASAENFPIKFLVSRGFNEERASLHTPHAATTTLHGAVLAVPAVPAVSPYMVQSLKH